MKMEVRVFTASPILVDEITDWFKGQEPRIPITVSVVEREGESRIAVYALFLDAPVVSSVAAGDALALGFQPGSSAHLVGYATEALDLLEKWKALNDSEAWVFPPELTAKTAELLKKAGRA